MIFLSLATPSASATRETGLSGNWMASKQSYSRVQLVPFQCLHRECQCGSSGSSDGRLPDPIFAKGMVTLATLGTGRSRNAKAQGSV